MKVGLLVGRETTFPEAFIEALTERGVDAELLSLGGTMHDDFCDYDVIVDRISHDVPYYRFALKQAALSGTRILNDPFWTSADDKFFGYSLVAKLGIPMPATLLLPNKSYQEDVGPESLRNLEYPIDWDKIVDRVGLPAFLKPADGGGWRHVYKVDSLEELVWRYDQTGGETMLLQRGVEFDRYIRCFCFGADEIIIARYDVDDRCYLPLDDYLTKAEIRKVNRYCRQINRALGYHVNTVEFAIADGEFWAIDFTNPAPDMDRNSLGEEYFNAVLSGMVEYVMSFEKAPRAKELLAAPMNVELKPKARAKSRAKTTKKKTTKKKAAKKKPVAKKATKKVTKKVAKKATKKTAKKKAKKKASTRRRS